MTGLADCRRRFSFRGRSFWFSW